MIGRDGTASVRAALRIGLWPAALFGVVMAVATVVLVNPPVLGLVNALIRFSGVGFQGNEALVGFVLSPLGLLTCLTIAFLALWTSLVEIAGLVAIGWESGHGRRMSQRGLWRHLAVKAWDITILAAILLAAAVAIVAPAAAAGLAVFMLLLGGADINYYLSAWPPEFVVAAGIFAALGCAAGAALAALLCRWIVALPLVIIDDVAPQAALRVSAELTAGHRWRIFVALLGWQLTLLGLGIALAWIVDTLENSLLQPGHSLNGLLVAGLMLTVAITAAGLVYRAVSGVLLGLIATAAYLRCRPALTRRAAPLAVPARRGRRGRRGRRLAALLALVLVATGANLVALSGLLGDTKTVEVTAHRAGALRAPENTLAALERAIAEGADFAEIDVQQTADGEVVVVHDTDLRRLLGLPRPVWQVRYEEIRDRDAGSWFDAGFASARISTLREFIAAARGRIRLNIELKKNGHNPDLADAVVALLRETNAFDAVVLTSLDLGYLVRLREREPRLTIGFIVATGIGSLPSIDVDFYAVAARLATPGRIRELERHGRGVHVWTLNSRDSLVAAVLAGADNVITDDPLLGREVAVWYRDMSAPERAAVRLQRLLTDVNLFGG